MTEAGSERTPAQPLPLLALLLPPLLVLAVGVLTPTGSLFPDQGDVSLYLKKASAFMAGAFPYRDEAFEYPPAAIIPMLVPYLAWVTYAVALNAALWWRNR